MNSVKGSLPIFAGLLLWPLVATGCISALAEGAALGEISAAGAIAEAAVMRTGAAAVAEGIAFRSVAGMSVVEGEAGMSIAISEELVAARTFRTLANQLESQSGLRMGRDPSGFLSISETRIVLQSDGTVTWGRTRQGGVRVIARLQDGDLWATDMNGALERRIGFLQAGSVENRVLEIRSSPFKSAPLVRQLQPGVVVDVVQAREGWFEVRTLDRRAMGWVESSSLRLSAAEAVLAATQAGYQRRGGGIVFDSAKSVMPTKAKTKYETAIALFENRSYGEASKLLLEAKNEGSMLAAAFLGFMYMTGAGIETDYPRALHLLELASDAGIPSASYNLGEMYFDGKGVKRDSRAAAQWYAKAFKNYLNQADLGDLESITMVGRMLSEGAGVKVNSDESIRYLQRAVNHQYPKAERLLGEILVNGIHVTKNRTLGLELLYRAQAHGDTLATGIVRKATRPAGRKN